MRSFPKSIFRIATVFLILTIGFSCKKDKKKPNSTDSSISLNPLIATANMDFTNLGKAHDFKCYIEEDFDEIIIEDGTVLKLNLRSTNQDGNEINEPNIRIEISSTKGFKQGDIFKVTDYYYHRSVLFSTSLYDGLSNEYLATNHGAKFGFGELEIISLYGDYIKGIFKFTAVNPSDEEYIVTVSNGEFESKVVFID